MKALARPLNRETGNMLNSLLSRPVYMAKVNGTFMVYLVKVFPNGKMAKTAQRVSTHYGQKIKPRWTARTCETALFQLFETRAEAQAFRKSAEGVQRINDYYGWLYGGQGPSPL